MGPVRISMMFSRRKRRESEPASVEPPEVGPGPGGAYCRVKHIRLYQPDEVLEARLTEGVDGLAAYLQTLRWVTMSYFGQLGGDFGSMGVLVVVGVRPGRRVKFWCDQVEGKIPTDVWDVFVKLLEGAGDEVRPTVTRPVAFAIAFLLGDGPPGDFPNAPSAWHHAATGHDSLQVPDELFEIVFPD
jgi:hypothetical protein